MGLSLPGSGLTIIPIATSATNLAGGAANQIPYQTAASTTSFIVAPTVNNTFLKWNGSAFVWVSSAEASDITVGTTTITSGTTTRILYDNAGVVGEYTISGTGTVVAMQTSPTFLGTPVIPTPFTLGAVSVTSTGTQLNYLSAATGTTGTTSTNIVFSTSPTLVTPALGAATGTSLALASATLGTNVFAAVGTAILTGATTTGPDWEVWVTGDTFARASLGVNTTDVARFSMGPGNAARDVFIERAGAANKRSGGPDAASPVAQIDSVQNVVVGTSNTAGAARSYYGSQSTGTGLGGSHQWYVSPAGSTGTAVNALALALTIDSTRLLTAPGAIALGGAAIGTNALAVTGTTLLGSQLTHGSGPAILTSPAAAKTQLGAADAAAPVAQTLSVQGVVAGTSNTAGANFIIAGSQSTGTGLGGTVAIQASPAGSTGTAQNALVTVATFSPTTLLLAAQGGTAPNITSAGQLRVLAGSANALLMGDTGAVLLSVNAANGIVGVGPSFGSAVAPGLRRNSTTMEVWLQDASAFTGLAAASISFGTTTSDTFLTRRGAANPNFGAADAATAVAQTLSVQGIVAGTADTAGQNWTLNGSVSTGAGVPGDLVFQTAGKGAASTVQNTLITALTIKGGTTNNTNVGQPSIIIGNAALGTTATDGFLYIPTCAGPPTGTPTTATGRVALVYDSTNHQFYIFDGGWKQPKTPAAAAIVTWQ